MTYWGCPARQKLSGAVPFGGVSAPGGNERSPASYAAFISYNRKVEPDKSLAEALETGLQSYARPWNRFRARRVFRDEKNLAAGPLWSALRSALDDSAFLIVIASPSATTSSGVSREIEYWCDNDKLGRKPDPRILLALCDGEIAWDHEANDFDWNLSTAVPCQLSGKFSEVPFWIDFRPSIAKRQLGLRNEDFETSVAKLLAGEATGRRLDELLAERDKQNRRGRMIRGTAVSLISLFAVLAAMAAIIANNQRDDAVHQTRIATSRLLAAQSDAARSTRLDLSVQLAAAALGTDPTSEARRSLIGSLNADRQIQIFLPASTHGIRTVSFVGGSRTILAVVDAVGTVALWDVDRRQRIGPGFSVGRVAAAAFSSGAKLLVTGYRDGTVRLWDVQARRPIGPPRSAGRLPVSGVAIAAVGDVVAATTANGTVVWSVTAGGLRNASRVVQGMSVSGLATTAVGSPMSLSRDGGLLAGSYVYVDTKTRQSALIDPGVQAERYGGSRSQLSSPWRRMACRSWLRALSRAQK